MEIIQEIAQCVPVSYTVDLDNPDVFILVEVFKACGFLFTLLGPSSNEGAHDRTRVV